ncbi:MAG: DUF1080 domain-containing protein [Planctomycetaceae bacterium]|jgi:hypothetical protein|nr:DUF1080 domain-containing protein [Planctomycetaceae bacterium]
MFARISLSVVLSVFLYQSTAAQTDAAFPKQEPGTKPPVLTGFTQLSEKELQEGTILLFDGISHYGWKNAAVKDGTLTFKGQLADSPLYFFGSKEVAGRWKENTRFTPKTQPIFDGKTLNGWKIQGKAAAKVENGAIRLTGGSGSLESEGKYADFVLQLEYKTDKPVNSGVFFRCIPGEVMNGYECQIFNNPPADDYKKFIGTDTGGIFRRQVGRNAGAKDGVWNYLTIVAFSDRIATWVNGIQVSDFQDDRKKDANPRKGLRTDAGTIQFQGHDATTDILFRNIRIGTM